MHQADETVAAEIELHMAKLGSFNGSPDQAPWDGNKLETFPFGACDFFENASEGPGFFVRDRQGCR